MENLKKHQEITSRMMDIAIKMADEVMGTKEAFDALDAEWRALKAELETIEISLFTEVKGQLEFNFELLALVTSPEVVTHVKKYFSDDLSENSVITKFGIKVHKRHTILTFLLSSQDYRAHGHTILELDYSHHSQRPIQSRLLGIWEMRDLLEWAGK